jgi:hypothetical protein
LLRLDLSQRDKVKIGIRKTTRGKIRFKRLNAYGIGEQIRKEDINPSDANQYIEWLITYNLRPDSTDYNPDLLISEHAFYIDTKGKRKLLYELPKIFYEMKCRNIITRDDLQTLINEINGYQTFLEGIPTYVECKYKELKIGSLNFKTTKWITPVFRIYNKDGTFIEAVKEKQQYAYQMQIMVYFCIPFGSQYVSENPQDTEEVVYVLGSDNKDSVLNLVKVFGCASQRHKHDILAILHYIQSLDR